MVHVIYVKMDIGENNAQKIVMKFVKKKNAIMILENALIVLMDILKMVQNAKYVL